MRKKNQLRKTPPPQKKTNKAIRQKQQQQTKQHPPKKQPNKKQTKKKKQNTKPQEKTNYKTKKKPCPAAYTDAVFLIISEVHSFYTATVFTHIIIWRGICEKDSIRWSNTLMPMAGARRHTVSGKKGSGSVLFPSMTVIITF